MRFSELLSGIAHTASSDFKQLDFDVKRVTCNSREAKKGDVFVAIKGNYFDGHRFVKYVSDNGANAAVVENMVLTRDDFVQIKVSDTRRALSLLARNFYGDPSRHVKVIGVTGTNGKTTVAYLLESIFQASRLKTGLIGTIRYAVDKDAIEAERTTPDTLLLNKLLRQMADKSVPYCFMEVSSHGLDQGRARDIRFNAAVFTNLSREHLDYHKTLENYLKAKMKLFEGLDKNSYTILNNDSPFVEELKYKIEADMLTYGLEKDSDVMAKNIRMNLKGSRFVATTPNGDMDIETPLLGRHNIYNTLAAVSVAVKEGLSSDVITKGVRRLKAVPGRLERIDCGQEYGVFVDYAHTEDALRNVLSSLRRLADKKIILVFGCGGDRDREKRPRMGGAAAELADFTIITSDNPRSENPAKIAKEIAEGFKDTRAKYAVSLDRYKAIENALLAADEDIVVLIAGKGHERTQTFADRIEPFDDREVARKILKKIT